MAKVGMWKTVLALIHSTFDGLLCSKAPNPSQKTRLALYFSVIVSITLHYLILSFVGRGPALKKFDLEGSNTRNGVTIQLVFENHDSKKAAIETANPEHNWRSRILDHDIDDHELAVASTKKSQKTPISGADSLASAGNVGAQIPVFEQEFTPRYPIQSLIKGIRGTVTASFRVGENGVPEDIEIISSTSTGDFDLAVIQALANTRIKLGSSRPKSAFSVTVIFDASGTNLQGKFSLKH